MDPREDSDSLPDAGLLVTAKRHLPGRKGEECNTLGSQECMNPLQKTSLIFRRNMLYHIVDKYYVKWFVLFGEIKEIRTEETTFSAIYPEIVPRIFNLLLGKVNSCHLAANQRKGQ